MSGPPQKKIAIPRVVANSEGRRVALRLVLQGLKNASLVPETIPMSPTPLGPVIGTQNRCETQRRIAVATPIPRTNLTMELRWSFSRHIGQYTSFAECIGYDCRLKRVRVNRDSGLRDIAEEAVKRRIAESFCH